MQMEMVAFVAMRPVYLSNNEIYLLAYQQFRLERAMTICPVRDELVSIRLHLISARRTVRAVLLLIRNP